MTDDSPLTADELFELLVLARTLILELERDRDQLKSEAVEVLELHESTVAHVSRLEAANTELATTNSLLTQEVAMLRKVHNDV